LVGHGENFLGKTERLCKPVFLAEKYPLPRLAAVVNRFINTLFPSETLQNDDKNTVPT
jgi:hypothetical protein